MLPAVLLALHTLAAILWIGGMFFAHMVLRPAVIPLPPEERLALWGRVFRRFFFWVWLAIALLLVTGYALVFILFGSMAGAGLFIHLMNGIGLVMMGLYGVLFFGPYCGFRRALAAGDWSTAARQQGHIRRIVTINMLLGLLTVILATGGRSFP
ncbi:MAG: integral membrane protein [Rhodospirillaceae bacterium]|nr:MAG: integral membrane protein [Rhodospirillaceae bacterium]